MLHVAGTPRCLACCAVPRRCGLAVRPAVRCCAASVRCGPALSCAVLRCAVSFHPDVVPGLPGFLLYSGWPSAFPTKTFLLLLFSCINMHISFPSAAFGGSSVYFCCRPVPCRRHWSVSPVVAGWTVPRRHFLRCPRLRFRRLSPTASPFRCPHAVLSLDCRASSLSRTVLLSTLHFTSYS